MLIAVAVHLLAHVLTFRFIQLRFCGEIIHCLQQAAILRFGVQPFAGAEEIHKEVSDLAPYPTFEKRQIAGRLRISFPLGKIDTRHDIRMVDIKIMRRVNVQIFIDPHTTQVVQYRNQQILHRQVTIMAEQYNAAVRKGIFRQFVTQASGRRPAKGKKIFFPLTLQPQRLRQFTLFIKQAIRLILGAIDPMQFSHHLDNGGCRLQQ